MIKRISQTLSLAALATALLMGGFTPSEASAQPAPRGASARTSQSVTVELLVVHATNQHRNVDASLKSVERHFKFLNYTGFTRLDRDSESLGVGDQTTVTVVGGRSMKVTLIEVDDRAAKLRVQLYKNTSKLLDTTVSIHRNRSFMVAGPQHDGGMLVFPLTVSY
ncbi:MAG: hypothetical protein KC912_05325 [Proteobacteria bacterium]|nr:hypothetical protein [Pseudomonadota bacterium]